MTWNRIDKIKPIKGQKVWYWFEPFKQICLGTYHKFYSSHFKRIRNQFNDKGGFLTDDVTFWLPFDDDEPTEPKKPSIKQRKECLYHPYVGKSKKL